jgi:selenocysteine-specific elongation factor
MRVIGTAGHVDHGKSTLVEALTGINPDRLKEERERHMTIELGFAWLTLPNGETAGVIDVPGHRDFIENMLAGVGGIDAVLFVIAADEGLMPQTREHLAILNLLHIPRGVIALTKTDLVEDEWLELISAEVAAAVRGTVLAEAPIVPVSARMGRGLPDLKLALQNALAACPPRVDVGRPRLPVDRVFSLAGFGTVVTGTLSDGAFALGDEVALLPTARAARIRGLQTHKTKIELAQPGSRVAVNLAGVEVSDLRRGMVLAKPNTVRPTALIDARFEHLAGSAQPLKHHAEIKFFLGASEVVGAIRLLEGDVLAPGAVAWGQLVLSEPVAAVKGQRFILRRPSPGETLGGGVIVDPHPAGRHKRRDPAILQRLATLAQGTPGELLLQALEALGPASVKDAAHKANLDVAALGEALAEARATHDLIELDGEALTIARPTWARFERDLRVTLAAYHTAHPLRAGMPREELKSRLKQNSKIFNALMAYAAGQNVIVASGVSLRLPTFQVTFTPAQQTHIDRLLADFRRDPHNTPSVKDCVARLNDELFAALVEQGRLTQISPEVVFLTETYTTLVERVTAHLRAAGKITVAEVRDLFTTSRKYALALMEHLDALSLTKRVGDERVLRG